MSRQRVALAVVDCAAFLLGYILVSRYATGTNQPVDPRVVARGDEPTWTVLAAVLTGVVAVLLWRLGRLCYRASRR